MGRRASGNEPLSKPYSFRLPDSEARELDAKIAASGLRSTSEFIRDYILKNRVVVAAKPGELEKRRLEYVLNRAANSLDQLARVLAGANGAQRLSDALFQQALRGLEDIARYLKAALDHVDQD